MKSRGALRDGSAAIGGTVIVSSPLHKTWSFLLCILAIALPARLALSSELQAAPSAPELRPDPGEPRRLPASAFFKPEVYVRGTDPTNAAATLLRSFGELGLEAIVVDSRSWLAESYPDPSRFDFDRVVIIAAEGIPHGRSTRRVQVEIIPVIDTATVALKFWEACGPSIAPDGTKPEWHPCGGPPSRAYRGLVEIVRQHITLADGGVVQ